MHNETDTKTYETPQIVEYGDLRELTEATNNFGNEDGGAKGVPGEFGGTGTFS